MVQILLSSGGVKDTAYDHVVVQKTRKMNHCKDLESSVLIHSRRASNIMLQLESKVGRMPRAIQKHGPCPHTCVVNKKLKGVNENG